MWLGEESGWTATVISHSGDVEIGKITKVLRSTSPLVNAGMFLLHPHRGAAQPPPGHLLGSSAHLPMTT
jgi:hypothetical protein